MTTFLVVNWLKLIGVAVGLFGIWKYFDSRKRELKWKKTEFLFSESKYFANDADLSECVQILEGRHTTYTIADIYPDSDDGPPAILECRHKFEKLLNFFDRLAYALFNQQTASSCMLTLGGLQQMPNPPTRIFPSPESEV